VLPSFTLSLRAAHRSPRTVVIYESGARRIATWLDAQGHSGALDQITPDHLRQFMLDLEAIGLAQNTVSAHYRGARALIRWAFAEDVIAFDPTAKVRPPLVERKPVPVLTDDEMRRLLKVCHGKNLAAKRDEALIRLMADTGLRHAEVVALTVDDVDLAQRIVTIRKGKGGKGRIAGFSHATAGALDRYLRTRRLHPKAGLSALWLSRSNSTTYGGLTAIVNRRATKAGIAHVHPHQLRHGWAHRALAAGMNPGDVMVLGGWSNTKMLEQVYGAALSAERAVAAAHRVALGDRM